MRERRILGEPHSPAERPGRPTAALRPGPPVAVALGLAALVLLVHVALVADGGWAPGPHTPPAFTALTEAHSTGEASADTATPAPRAAEPPTVRVTQVRWLVADGSPSARPPQRPSATPPSRPKAPPPKPTPAREAPAAAPTAPVAEVPAPEMETASAALAAAPAEQAPPSSLPKASPPPGAHLVYDVQGTAKGIRYQASGELNWVVQDGRYDARMEVKMFLLGSRVQTSTGTLGPDGLRPERFADIRRGERAAHFERDAGRIRFSSNAPEAPLQAGAQDRLSLFLQIAGLLQATPRHDGEVMSFQVAGTGGAETWRFEVGPEETLALPAGEVVARRVVRRPRETHDTTVEMWFAPTLHHLPVRLRLTQANGDVADQLLRTLP